MFITQGPVHPESPLFVARADELGRMESWVAQVRCVGSLLGARQTGKTSLLLRLRHQLRDKYSFAFVNFEGLVGGSDDDCFRYVVDELLDQLGPFDPPLEPPAAPGGPGFLRLLRAMSRQSRAVRIVVLLDELGALPPTTAAKFAHSLRAAFVNRLHQPELDRFVFILSGATDLLELTTGNNSPLKNVTESLYLRDFTADETRHLVRAGLQGLDEGAVQSLCAAIHRWTNGHPYLTQATGSRLGELGAPPTEDLVHEVVEDLIEHEDKNLPHVCRALDDGPPVLWQTVRRVIGGECVPFSRANPAVAALELIGAIRNADSRCAIRNDLYREMLRGRLRSGPTGPRADDRAESLRQDLALLEEYEDVLRYEDDPARRARYRRKIAELRASVAEHRQEHGTPRPGEDDRAVERRPELESRPGQPGVDPAPA